MSKITTFDKATCLDLRRRLDAALAPLAADLGIEIKLGRATFTPGSMTIKVEAAAVADGRAETRLVLDFRRMAPLVGLAASDLGRAFTIAGRRFTIEGYRAAAPKRPIMAREDGGKAYAFMVEEVRRAFLAEFLAEAAAASAKGSPLTKADNLLVGFGGGS